jgi:flagellar basal-body rod modification protein FlgD
MTTISAITAPASATDQKGVAASSDVYSGLSTMFLDLLVAQIRHQNPLDPMDGTQYVSQLAEFANVESLQSIKLSLNKNQLMDESLLALQATGLIGQRIDVPAAAKVLHSQGVISGSVNPGSGAERVYIRLYDSSGNMVEDLDLAYRGAGTLKFDFPEKSAGIYQVMAEASQGGVRYPLQTWLSGSIEGVSLGNRPEDIVIQVDGLGPHSLMSSVKHTN